MAERDTRAMVSAGWWLGTPPQQRQNLIAGRMLALPDGSWWLFGAWGRWYRWTSTDGQWHLCPPPRLTITRMSARPLRQGIPVPPVPPHVVPTGPDLAYDPPPPLGFVDAGIRPEVTSRVRATVESAAALPTPDYPHWWGLFSPAMPSTVPVTWGVMLWCATAPVFDARIDAQLLGLWSSYRARPLPEVDGPRWLTPPPLESLIGLYAGRLRAGRVDTAVVILRTLWAIASALREDSRFQPRADALIAMLGVTLHNPTVDYGALSYGDRAVVQQWLTRCPPSLAPALRVEASAGEHFRNAYYDLATALTPVAGDPSERGYVEPRLIAAALLAADLAVVRQEVSNQVIGWLDPQVSGVMRAMLIQRDHPLRPFWPENDRLPRSLRERMDAAGPAVRNALLATMYGADLAWCRLGGGIPARPRGFPSSVAILAEIIGPRRATSATSAEPASPAPGIAPLAHQYPSNPGGAGRLPSVPMAQEPPTGPPGQAPAWASPSASPPPISPSPSAPPASPAPPATEAWDGAQPWPAAGVRDAGAGDADTPDPRPDDARPNDAWPGAGDAGRPVSPPQATEAWSGAEGLEPDRPKPPPPAEAWPGTGEREPGPPAPYGSPPGSGERGIAGTGPPPPPPPTQAWPGGEVPDVDGPISPPPATQAWPGTGDPVAGDVASRPPATQAWPGTGEREVGGAASPAPVTQAWREADEQDVAGTPPPSSPAEAEPVEGEPSGTGSPVPVAESRLGTPGDVDPPAWPGSGEGDLSSTGGETPDPGERDPGEEVAPPPVTEARAEGLADGEPFATRAWTEAELREATEGPPSAGSFSSTGEPEPATSTGPPATAPVAEATDSDDDSSATWPWTDAERIEALGDPPAAGSRSPRQDAQDLQGGQDAEVDDDRTVADAADADAGGGLHGRETPGRRGMADDRYVAGSAAGLEDLTPVDPGGAGADRTMADPGEVPYEPTLVSQHAPSPPAPDDGNDDNTALDPDDDAPEHDDSTTPDRGTAGEDLTMTDPPEELEEPEEMVNNATMLDPLDSSAGPAKNATYVDWIDGTLSDAGPIPLVAPSPVTPGPPRTRMLDEQVQDPARPPDPPSPPAPPQHPGTRIMSGTMVGGFLGVAPMPDKPVEQIAPPRPAPMPKVAERFGIRFLSGIDDATELFDGLRRKASADPPVPPPALLIVGDPHTGQRRLTRLIARTLAGAGVGDGSVRTADGSELRGDHAATVTAILRGGGPPLLFERLDRAILDAADPDRVVAAVTRARADKTVLIATATPDSYTRLAGRYPGLTREFEVFRLPDLSGPGTRLALLHVLADERRVTINASGLDVVRGDLARLAGYGDLVGARLVEAYLDRAVSRHTEREGAPRDRMVLQPVDFAGVAEDIEPVLRPPRDVDGFLRGLEEMIGLDEVKHTVGGLVAEARMAADRNARGLPSGNPSRHLIFLGRPGTGKTTVAGLIGGIYAALNLLDSGHLVVCSARDLAGGDPAAKVAAQVDRAGGGVLFIDDAYLLDRMSAAVDELSRLMGERRDKFMVVCAGLPDEMEGFLLANPGFRAEFGAIVEFREPTERQLVQLFSRLAERDLYMLDEELRVELLDRFAGMRRYPGFAFAGTVRRLFDQIVARQASRLAGAQVNPAAVARLSIRDLPESEGGRLLQELHPNRPHRSPE